MMASGGLGLAEEELRARPFRLQMVTSDSNFTLETSRAFNRHYQWV